MTTKFDFKMRSEPKKSRVPTSLPLGPAIDDFWSDGFFSNEHDCQRVSDLLQSDSTRHFRQMMWPHSLDFNSFPNAIYLIGCQNLAVLNEFPYWIVRDGLVPLLWFFKCNPKPGLFKQKLLVQESLVYGVPKAWQKNIGTYRIRSDSNSNSTMREIIVYGATGDIYISEKHFEESLSKLASEIKSNGLSSFPVKIFIQYKTVSPSTRDESFSKKIVEIFKILGTSNLSFLSWNQVENFSDLRSSYLFSIESTDLITDDYLNHYFLSLGGVPLKKPSPEREPARSVRKIQLSSFHRYEISPDFPRINSVETLSSPTQECVDFLTKAEEAVRSQPSGKLPWPQWFQSWQKICSAAEPNEIE